jgi:hypothetical protein
MFIQFLCTVAFLGSDHFVESLLHFKSPLKITFDIFFHISINSPTCKMHIQVYSVLKQKTFKINLNYGCIL